MKPLLHAILGILMLHISACGNDNQTEPNAADRWFPLEPQWEWQYRTTKTTDEGISRGEYLIENLEPINYFDEHYLVRRDLYGTYFYFNRDTEGVFRVGKRTLVAKEIQFDRKPRLVIPANADSSLNWFVDSHPYVLERLQPVRETFTRQNVFQMTYEIISADNTLEVPAGKFENVLHIRATGTATVLADLARARYGASDAEITTDEWYAKGVGMIKLLRTEHFPNQLFSDGSYLMELEALHRR